MDRSLRDQARLGNPVDEETVERYAEAMRGGAEFPAVVGWRGSEAKLILIDGNHRQVAAERSDYENAVYVVTGARPT